MKEAGGDAASDWTMPRQTVAVLTLSMYPAVALAGLPTTEVWHSTLGGTFRWFASVGS